MGYFRRQFISNSILDIFNLGLALCTSIIIARGLGVKDRGHLAGLIAFIYLSTIFNSFILSRYELIVGRYPSAIKLIVISACREQFFLFLFVTIFIYLLYFLDFSLFGIEPALGYFHLMAINILLVYYSMTISRLLLSVRLMFLVGVSNIIGGIVYSLILLYLYMRNELSVYLTLMANSMMLFVTSIFLSYFLFRNNFGSCDDSYLSYKKYTIIKKLGASTGDIISNLYLRGPLLFISTLGFNEQAGFLRIITFFQDGFLRFPRVAAMILRSINISARGGWKKVIVLSNVVLIFSLLSAALLYLTGDHIIILLFSNKYKGLGGLTAIIVLSSGAWASSSLFSTQYNIKNHFSIKFNIYLTIIFSVLAMFVCGTFFYYGPNLDSFVYAYLVGSFVYLISILVYIIKNTKLRWKNLLIL